MRSKKARTISYINHNYCSTNSRQHISTVEPLDTTCPAQRETSESIESSPLRLPHDPTRNCAEHWCENQHNLNLNLTENRRQRESYRGSRPIGCCRASQNAPTSCPTTTKRKRKRKRKTDAENRRKNAAIVENAPVKLHKASKLQNPLRRATLHTTNKTDTKE